MRRLIGSLCLRSLIIWSNDAAKHSSFYMTHAKYQFYATVRHYHVNQQFTISFGHHFYHGNFMLECFLCLYSCPVFVTGLKTKNHGFKIDWSLWLETISGFIYSFKKYLLSTFCCPALR